MAGDDRYRIYGLSLSSPRPLPLMAPDSDPVGVADIILTFAPVPDPVEPPVRQMRRLSIFADGTGLHRAIRGARFLIRAGREIVADLPPETGDAELHALLCGIPLGWLMIQRRRPPMHACVVAAGPMAVVIAGDSGAGKSTLARCLIGRGYGLVSDDQAVIDPVTRLVHPGYPAMKLMRGTALSAGDAVMPDRQVRDGLEKYFVPMPERFRHTPLELGLVVVLSTGPEIRLEQAERHDAAALLLRSLYRPELSRTPQEGRVALDWSLALARSVPVFRLTRTGDLAHLPNLADAVGALVAGCGG